MTDDPSTNESPEHDPRSQATQALLDELRETFDQNFGDQFEKARFDVVQEEEGEEEERWKFSLTGTRSENEDFNGEEQGKYEFLLDPLSGGESAEKEKVYLKIRGEGEVGKINLHIRGSGRGKWKKFELMEIADTEEGWEVGQKASPEYGNRKFSQNVLEVWFSQRDDKEKEEEETLQIPVHLESDLSGDLSEEMPANWGTFSDEGLKIVLPDIQVGRDGHGEGFQANVGSREGWRQVGLSFLMYWVICNVYAGNGTLRRDNDHIPKGFPKLEKYRAKRPVNLNPAKVIDELEAEDRDDKLYFPWHVIESACSALNAGKNVIFTGPPGGGKSKLASFLAKRATGQDPLMTTASPAWSTGDLIGRYMPDREGPGLVFQEGMFLRALDDPDKRSRWLVIDEFNRADIDACFGELFSVLAGDAVELPFEKEEVRENETEEEEAEEAHPVRIVPEGDDTETEVDYLVPDKFRLIGTMNDADRSRLNDLSFALMRRFAIIHVGSPKEGQVKTIIENEVENTTADLDLEKNAWNVKKSGTTRCGLESIKDELERLFTPRGSKGTDEEIEDLVSDSVVGVSVIGDVIRFVGEGIRTEAKGESLDRSDDLEEDSPWNDMDDLAEKLTLSYLALASVLQIFPQLEALEMGTQQEQNKLFQAVLHIFEAFHEDHEDKLVMLRVKRENENYTLESEETIGDFLFRNLKTRFPRQAETWEDDLNKYLSDENTGDDTDEDANA
jgi:hypothetical protein